MFKKVIAFLCALSILLVTVAGCATQKQEGKKQEPAKEQKADEAYKGKQMTIYIRMMDMQDKWFRENIIVPFEKKYGVKITVNTFEKEADLKNILELDKDKKTIGLVKTPHMMLNPLVKYGLMASLEEAAGDKVKEDLKEYTEQSLELATIDGKVYYIPRKLETNTLLFLKSKVKDAVDNWEKMKEPINEMFKKENGVGLPADYKLEADPNEWDWFDLAVVGYYWANTEYDGKKEPRIAHRAKKYEGTTVEMLTKIYQMGGKPEDVLKMNTQLVKDMFGWEVFFKKNNLYNPAMWEEAWSGGGIWNAMAAGKVYLAFMHQIDAFFIHGGTNPEMTGYLANPDDMGVAIMPKGVSLEMKDGKPVREGEHASQMAGWWWGIPKASPDMKLSYELARWITNKENHKKEVETFGMMPVRKDMMENVKTTFSEPWMQEVFDVAAKQSKAGMYPAPQVQQWPAISNLYLEAWYDIVVGDNNKDIGKVLDSTYAPKAAEALK
ncbi:extracellular solute-binding protein [Petroclostridium xylanilyticum]|uniref:extracellular solute-binding protein n=1 Tax=Petroclostridium xylanilyticum TaxID=1792311 RepID=UPI000B97F8CD|nr:extracellular solute-binding protein [Petroclostridium xylanilyticum]